MVRNITLGLIQMSMSTDKDANLAKAVRMIGEAAKKGADIVCLPELFNVVYFPQEEKAQVEAEEIPGKTTAALAEAAKSNRVVIVGGSIFERDTTEKLGTRGKTTKNYNTTAVFDETGKMLGTYRKIHVPHDENFYEQNYFEPGDLGFKTFKIGGKTQNSRPETQNSKQETENWKLATLICYDQWYPEAARSVALMGAEIVFYPTAIGTVQGIEQTEGDWHNSWETVMRGHAIANGMIVAAVNRVGTEGKMDFWGGSFVCDAFGKIIAKGSRDKEEVIIAKCDIDHGKSVRDGWRFFYNRRPETYGMLTKK
ncbi:MAG: carbon-nitrogen hydrolase [Candidatus Micrarchaeota archaeon]